jgi:peptidoglycan/LPS O-acetylase OafA/YrhL
MDAMRGLAALAVVAFHIRYNFFVVFDELTSVSWATRAFYAATSFGHDAVVAFFVLSGFLISGSILKDARGGRWTWTRYLTNRLTRLWVVLIPGLFLTLFWDQLGMHLFPGSPVYTGAPQEWHHNFFPVEERETLRIFLANIVFLHSVRGVPAFGTDGPLWSVTWEFAYYLIFPMLLLSVWPRTKWAMRIVYVALAAVLYLHFGSWIMMRFPIWLMGFAVQLLPLTQLLSSRRNPTPRNLMTCLIMIGVVVITHAGAVRSVLNEVEVDWVNGVVFAAGLYVLLHDRRTAGETLYVKSSRGAAALSYSLYVVHMPLLVFLRALSIEGRPWELSLATGVAAVLLAVTIVAYAAIVWYLFESRTGRVREFATEQLRRFRGTNRQEAAQRAPA